MRSMRIIPLIIMAILVGVLFWRLEAGTPPAHRSPLIGQALPATLMSSLYDATTTSLQMRKEKPYLINVFASWCLACVAEHPILQEIAQTQNIEVVGFNWKDEKEAAKAWLAHYGNPYSIVLTDPGGEAGLELGITGAPETFLVSGEGIILQHNAGPLTWEVWEKQFIPYLTVKKL